MTKESTQAAAPPNGAAPSFTNRFVTMIDDSSNQDLDDVRAEIVKVNDRLGALRRLETILSCKLGLTTPEPRAYKKRQHAKAANGTTTNGVAKGESDVKTPAPAPVKAAPRAAEAAVPADESESPERTAALFEKRRRIAAFLRIGPKGGHAIMMNCGVSGPQLAKVMAHVWFELYLGDYRLTAKGKADNGF